MLSLVTIEAQPDSTDNESMLETTANRLCFFVIFNPFMVQLKAYMWHSIAQMKLRRKDPYQNGIISAS